MSSSGLSEAKTGEIRIDDTDADSFKHFLRFIYCGKLPVELKEIADSLMPIADKYGLQELKDACEEALKNRLNNSNVIRTLIMAHLYCCSDLKKECCKVLSYRNISLQHESTYRFHVARHCQQFGKEDIELLMSHPGLLADEESRCYQLQYTIKTKRLK